MPPAESPFLTYVALACAVVVAPVHGWVGDLFAAYACRVMPRKLPVLANVYQSRMLIRMAILEATAFFCLISFIVEGVLVTPVAALLLLGCMALRFPTRARLEAWIETMSEHQR